ncbi:hypothetical protein B7463_g1633, partial [Scytalidium lignicola]
MTAASVMVARNKQYPKLHAQMLLCPMLDGRVITISSKQSHTNTPCSGVFNATAWETVLGDRRRTPDVSELLAPARATNLSDHPPAIIDVGECEVFRDEAVAYASKMWECGSSAELYV